MLLGIHCSISGGLHNAVHEAESLDADTFQIFTKNQRQWFDKEIKQEELDLFRETQRKSKVKTAFAHAIYLINIASPDDKLRNMSIKSLTTEINRCHGLGLLGAVLHPGAAKEQTEKVAIQRIADGIKQVLKDTSEFETKILLENTAGQGTTIGGKFEHLKEIMDQVDSPRVGLCFDTCHAFAAGFDIRTKQGFEQTMEELDKIVGLNHLDALHLNDSKGELGSHLDRHDHIGKGKIGLEPFKVIMKTFQNIPKVLETPKEDEMDAVNLKVLRALA